jgi:hypothetical protein
MLLLERLHIKYIILFKILAIKSADIIPISWNSLQYFQLKLFGCFNKIKNYKRNSINILSLQVLKINKFVLNLSDLLYRTNSVNFSA